MKKTRFLARQRLKLATKAEFETLLDNANLTPIQLKIIRLHICKGYSVCKIAMALSCCDSSVKKHLAKIYDKIHFLGTFTFQF